MDQPNPFQDLLHSPGGRARLGRWAGGGAIAACGAFAFFIWYADAYVPFFFWPFIAVGGAGAGVRVCLAWREAANRRSGA